jgi:propanediol dehydratase small subunit
MRDMARRLRRDYDAERIAGLIEEAAEVYERRGLFKKRF